MEKRWITTPWRSIWSCRPLPGGGIRAGRRGSCSSGSRFLRRGTPEIGNRSGAPNIPDVGTQQAELDGGRHQLDVQRSADCGPQASDAMPSSTTIWPAPTCGLPSSCWTRVGITDHRGAANRELRSAGRP